MYRSSSSNTTWSELIISTVFLVALIIGVRSCNHSKADKKDAEWNNGICEVCHEGQLQFKNATSAYAEMDKYFYECDKCGHVQFFYRLQK